MVYSTSARVDPAADAASLLRRIGFAVLCVAMPFAAIGARRSSVILMPIGVILLILAALLEPAEKSFGTRLKQLLLDPVSWAILGFGLWTVLSLAWAPAPRTAADRAANIAGLLAVLIGGLASIPSRLRAPTLYLLPIGAFIAVAAASVAVLDARLGRFLFTAPADAATVQRGLATLMLMSVPAAGWLLSRGRIVDAVLLGVALLAVAIAANDLVMAASIVIAALVFAVMRMRPAAGMTILALLLLLIVSVALLPLLVKTWQGQSVAGMQLMPLYSGSFLRRLGRLVTGYGLETAPRMAADFHPAGATYFAGLWFDLGIMAVILIGAGMGLVLQRARRSSHDVAAAALALMTVATVQGLLVPGSYQAWWASSLIAAIIGVAAISRGQARSRRPGIGLFTRPAAAKP